MNIIKLILSSVQKVDDVVKVVKALLAGIEAFTNSLKDSLPSDTQS